MAIFLSEDVVEHPPIARDAIRRTNRDLIFTPFTE